MPREPYEVSGPQGGLSELRNPSHIAPNDFVIATNVQNDGGQIRPRPGYELVSALTVDSNSSISSTNGVRCMTLDTTPDPDEIFFTTPTAVRKIQAESAYTESAVYASVDGATDVRGIARKSSTLYICAYDKDAIYTAATSPGSVTALISSISTQIGFYSFFPTDIRYSSTDNSLYITGNGTIGLSGGTDLGVVLKHNLTTSITSSIVSSLMKIFGAVEVWYAKDRIYVARCDNVAPVTEAGVGSSLTPSNSIDVYDLSGTFQYNVSVGGLGYPTGFWIDTTNSRLWMVCSNTGSVIAYADLDSNGDIQGISTSQSLSSSSVVGFMPLINADGELFWSNPDASAGGINVASSNRRIVSGFWWRNDVIGIDSEPDDVVLLQSMDETVGGSVFHAWFPLRTAPDDLVALSPQYTQGTGGDPDIFVMPDRDSDGSSTTPIVSVGNFSRSSFAHMGKGLDTHAGGVLIATGDGALVFNYHKGEADATEVQLITAEHTATGGTFKLTFAGQQTNAIAYNANSATVQTELQALSTIGSGNATVSGTLVAGMTVTFASTLASRGLPFIWMSNNAVTTGGGQVPYYIRTSETTAGQQHANGMLWLRPAGLPRPSAPTGAATAATSANPNGVYDYVISYFSSRLNIESPPSAIEQVDTSSAQAYIDLTWTNPTTNYFDETYGSSVAIRPVIDYVRIYRKRRGNAIVGTDPDGNAADQTYRFVAQVPAIVKTYRDNSVPESLLEDQPPSDKEYPPADAQYVTIHQQRAFYVQAAQGTRLVWFSTASPIIGSVADGELSYEYVPADAFFEVSDLAPTDHSITGIRGFGGTLAVFTDERLFGVDTTDVDLGIPYVRPIEGAVGCASHHCIVESNPLPDLLGGMLFWPHPIGGLYGFDGVRSVPAARTDIADSIATWSRKTWQDLSQFSPAASSWYYATAISDPDNNRIILAVPLLSGTVECYCYSLDTNKWVKWDFNPSLLLFGRDITGAMPTLNNTPYMAFGNGIYILRDGCTDNGQPFDWQVRTGQHSAGVAWSAKKWYDGVVLLDRKDFGGTTAQLTVTPIVDGTELSTVVTATLPTTGAKDAYFTAKGTRGRYFALDISGTHSTDSADHPILLGWAIDRELTGTRMRVKKAGQ